MSMYVCLSVRADISGTTSPNLAKFSVLVACSRGSDLIYDVAMRYVLSVLRMYPNMTSKSADISTRSI